MTSLTRTTFFMGQKQFKVCHIQLKYVVTRLYIRTGRGMVRVRLGAVLESHEYLLRNMQTFIICNVESITELVELEFAVIQLIHRDGKIANSNSQKAELGTV